MARRLGFRKAQRLLRAVDFKTIFDHPQQRISRAGFLMLAGKRQPVDNEMIPVTRLGLVVGKKNTPRAVDRARLKRLIREGFRKKQHNIPAMDIVVVVRGSSAQSNNKITSDLEYMFGQLEKN